MKRNVEQDETPKMKTPENKKLRVLRNVVNP